ncbi:MAG: site-2 protease family protein [bacterium]
MISTIIIFVLVLTLLIAIHELGHFLAAKMFGIRVDEFAIGFPPRLFHMMIGKTKFAMNLVPLGGYVKIHGENPEDSLTQDSILAKPKWQQIVVLIAGVTFNVILAYLFLVATLMIGTKVSVDTFPGEVVQNPKLIITTVLPGAPAELVGIKPGDEILSISNGKDLFVGPTLSILNVQKTISTADKNVSVTVKRLSVSGVKSSSTASVTSSTSTQEITSKEEAKAFNFAPVVSGDQNKKMAGISMDMIGEAKIGFFKSFYYAGIQTFNLLENITIGLSKFIGSIFVGKGSLKEVTGPIGIANVVGDSAKAGITDLFMIIAVISANLAVINMVPFPALDGGRVVVVIIEAIIRRPIKASIIGWVNGIGFIVLIGLMVVVTFKDIFYMFK